MGWRIANSCAIPDSSRFHSFRAFLVWTSENDIKTLMGMKIFCFVFAAMKMDTFESAVVWIGP